jgi:amino acid permease
MLLICYLFAILIPNIGDAISITGATINPFIGFIFPIMYYLKLDPTPIKSV